MRRAGALLLRALIPLCVVFVSLPGCGQRREAPARGDAISFETLADTAGLADGPPILEHFEAYRLAGGSLRAKGHLRFPPGTRVQLAVKPAKGAGAVATVQVVVAEDGSFETPPIMSPSGPLPVAPYRFELSSEFTTTWQTADVLHGTDDGKALRGPGITRTSSGGAMFWHVEELTR